MAARYFTKVVTEYLDEIRAGLPAALTMTREVGQLAHEPGVTLVEIQDDDAPDTMTGHLVALTFRSTTGEDTAVHSRDDEGQPPAVLPDQLDVSTYAHPNRVMCRRCNHLHDCEPPTVSHDFS